MSSLDKSTAHLILVWGPNIWGYGASNCTQHSGSNVLGALHTGPQHRKGFGRDSAGLGIVGQAFDEEQHPME